MSAAAKRFRKARGVLATMQATLAQCRRSLAREKNPERRAKLDTTIGIKCAIIAKLKGEFSEHQTPAPEARSTVRREIAGPKYWDWVEVETIAGEFEPFWFDDEGRQRDKGARQTRDDKGLSE